MSDRVKNARAKVKLSNNEDVSWAFIGVYEKLMIHQGKEFVRDCFDAKKEPLCGYLESMNIKSEKDALSYLMFTVGGPCDNEVGDYAFEYCHKGDKATATFTLSEERVEVLEAIADSIESKDYSPYQW